jgi:hypothetical protein
MPLVGGVLMQDAIMMLFVCGGWLVVRVCCWLAKVTRMRRGSESAPVVILAASTLYELIMKYVRSGTYNTVAACGCHEGVSPHVESASHSPDRCP